MEKGEKGDTGAQGIQGIQGERGPEGFSGSYGFIPDPYFEQATAKWEIAPAGAAVLRAFAADAPTLPPGGTQVLENQISPPAAPTINSVARVPVNPQRTYEVSGLFRLADAAGSAGGVSLSVFYYDINSVFLSKWTPTSLATPGTSWVTYSAKFGAGTANAIPAGAQFMTVAAQLNLDAGDVPGNRLYQVTGLTIMPSAPPAPAKYAPLMTSGCNTTNPGGTNQWQLNTRTFTLDRPQLVTVVGKVGSWGTGYRYIGVYVDGALRDYNEISTSAVEYFAFPVMWTGTLGAGSHTINLSISRADYAYCYENTKQVITFQDP